MARNSLLCADVPLRNYSLTHSLTHSHTPPKLTSVNRMKKTPWHVTMQNIGS